MRASDRGELQLIKYPFSNNLQKNSGSLQRFCTSHVVLWRRCVVWISSQPDSWKNLFSFYLHFLLASVTSCYNGDTFLLGNYRPILNLPAAVHVDGSRMGCQWARRCYFLCISTVSCWNINLRKSAYWRRGFDCSRPGKTLLSMLGLTLFIPPSCSDFSSMGTLMIYKFMITVSPTKFQLTNRLTHCIKVMGGNGWLAIKWRRIHQNSSSGLIQLAASQNAPLIGSSSMT